MIKTFWFLIVFLIFFIFVMVFLVSAKTLAYSCGDIVDKEALLNSGGDGEFLQPKHCWNLCAIFLCAFYRKFRANRARVVEILGANVPPTNDPSTLIDGFLFVRLADALRPPMVS